MQAVLIFPALLFTIMVIVQFALYLHAQAVAEAAAQDGAAAARRADGSTTSGHTAATGTLNRLGPRMLTAENVTVDRTATTARVIVTGTVISLVPGVTLRVRESAEAPVERFSPIGQ